MFFLKYRQKYRFSLCVAVLFIVPTRPTTGLSLALGWISFSLTATQEDNLFLCFVILYVDLYRLKGWIPPVSDNPRGARLPAILRLQVLGEDLWRCSHMAH